jgi:hypothetical protein
VTHRDLLNIAVQEAFRNECYFPTPGQPAWPGYDRKRAYFSHDRCPILEWEEQDGFGWAWSYVYRRSWALTHPFTSNNRGEEEGQYQQQYIACYGNQRS